MNEQHESPLVFVLMPFDSEFDEVYEQFITPIMNEAGFRVRRADDLLNQANIMHDVVTSIASADLLLADLTGSNPNVYYELGLAHALRKPVILLTQDVEELPFDLRSYRVIEYSTHFARIQDAKRALTEVARAVRQGGMLFSSPVTDGLPSPEPTTPVTEEGEEEEGEEEESEEGELGVLDHLVQLGESMDRLTALSKEIGERTEAIGSETSVVTQAFQEGLASPSAGTPSHLRKLTRGLGGSLQEYADFLRDGNVRYSEHLTSLNDSLEFVIRFKRPSNQEERDTISEMLASLESLMDSARGNREAFSGLAASVLSTPSVERRFNRAKTLAAGELNGLVRNVDRLISILERAIRLGKEMLQNDDEQAPHGDT